MRLNGQHVVVLTHNYCDHLYAKGACKPQYALQAWGQKHLNSVATCHSCSAAPSNAYPVSRFDQG